jgi:hypothetical protein
MAATATKAADSDQTVSGPLRVVPSACKFAPDRSSGIIAIEYTPDDLSTAIENLNGSAAKNLALAYGVKCGVSDARINGIAESPYPVDKDGKLVEVGVPGPDGVVPDVKEKAGSIRRYRVDIPITRRPI